MAKESAPDPAHVADVTFVEIEIAQPADTRMRVEFECGLHIAVADDSRTPLVGSSGRS